MKEEDIRNAQMRKRLIWLIPFNFAMMFGTMKYFQNVKFIAKRFWPNRTKATIGNLMLVGTA
jgi:hypothetical protein